MDNRRFLLAILLSIGVLTLWGWLFPPTEEPQLTQPASAPAAEQSPIAPGGAPPPGATSPLDSAVSESTAASMMVDEPQAALGVSAEREQTEVVETETYRAEFTNRGAQLVSFLLAEHANSDGAPLNLVRARESRPYPFGLMEQGGEPSPLNDVLFQVDRNGGEIVFRYRGSAGAATKRFTFAAGSLFEVDISFDDGRSRSVVMGPGIRNPTEKELENRFERKSAVYRTLEDDTETVDPKGEKAPVILPGTNLRWVGLQDTYFLTALVFTSGPPDQVVLEPLLGEPGSPMRFRSRPADMSDEEESFVPELDLLVRPQANRLQANAYWGPKVYEDLESLGVGLEKAVALGPFRLLARPLLIGLRWIHANIVSNYGWAIILMTLGIRIILFPLNHKSVVSMQRMQQLNPKIQAIRQKYRSKLKDKQGRPNPEMQRKQNEEIMALYKQEGVNPAGGCLPLLLQIPVLFAFYSLLSTAIELRNAPWVGWIQDLASPDPLLVLPIVMGATQFLQQKITPSAADPMQRRIFMLMPIFFTILFLGFPSGLVLYWLTNNVLGIAQQLGYKRFKERQAAG